MASPEQPSPDPGETREQSGSAEEASRSEFRLPWSGNRGRHAKQRRRRRDRRILANTTTDGLLHEQRLARWRARRLRGEAAIDAVGAWTIVGLQVVAAFACAAFTVLGVVLVILGLEGASHPGRIAVHVITGSVGATGSFYFYRLIRRHRQE